MHPEDTGIPEELLSAYLDGELPHDQRQQIADALQRDARAQQVLDEFQRQRQELQALPRRSLPASFSKQIVARCVQREQTASVPGNRRSSHRERAKITRWAVAATLLIACLAITALYTQQRMKSTTQKLANVPEAMATDNDELRAVDEPQLQVLMETESLSRWESFDASRFVQRDAIATTTVVKIVVPAAELDRLTENGRRAFYFVPQQGDESDDRSTATPALAAAEVTNLDIPSDARTLLIEGTMAQVAQQISALSQNALTTMELTAGEQSRQLVEQYAFLPITSAGSQATRLMRRMPSPATTRASSAEALVENAPAAKSESRLAELTQGPSNAAEVKSATAPASRAEEPDRPELSQPPFQEAGDDPADTPRNVRVLIILQSAPKP